MKKNRLPIVLLFVLGGTMSVLAQKKDTFEEQKRAFEKTLLEQNQAFGKTQSRQSQKYTAFKDKLNGIFGEYLKKNWEKNNTKPAQKADNTPKPQQTPQDLNPDQPQQDLNLDVIASKDLPEINAPESKVPSILKVPVTPKTDPSENPNMVTFNYLDTKQFLPYLDDLHISLNGTMDFEAIANYWNLISQKDYLYFVQGLMRRKIELQLNDWGYYALVRSIGRQISGEDQNEERLFTWFILNQSGYRARVGYINNQVYLVMPTKSIIYRTTYFKVDDLFYYVMDAPVNATMSLHVYEKDYPDAKNVLELNITKPLQISENIAYRDLSFRYMGQDYTLKIAYSASSIQLFEYYPLTDLDVFFKAPPSEIAAKSLKENLAPLVADKSETEAVGLLLRFVQKAFDYQVDQAQFGREKTFFIEETLHYPYADCEDRSILFAYLVKELVGLKVVGLDYPGHVTTAVRFSESVEGNNITHQGDKYLICDPTYINAGIGRAMDTYKNLQAKVIDLD